MGNGLKVDNIKWEIKMTNENKMVAGDFCWTELLSDDIKKSTEFYTQLFCWDVESMDMGNNELYTMFKVGPSGIAGGMQKNAEMGKMEVPSHWNSYVLVDDINAAVKKAKDLGAKILKDIDDVADMGKFAVIMDPTGATFSFWQILKKGQGEPLSKKSAGNIGWNELITKDTDKAGKFYTSLFNWTIDIQKMPSGEDYITFMNNDKPVAGMLKPSEDKQASHWGIYVSVSKLDETISKAKKLGATICCDPITVENVGRFTTIRDPEGVYFSVIEFS